MLHYLTCPIEIFNCDKEKENHFANENMPDVKSNKYLCLPLVLSIMSKYVILVTAVPQ